MTQLCLQRQKQSRSPGSPGTGIKPQLGVSTGAQGQLWESLLLQHSPPAGILGGWDAGRGRYWEGGMLGAWPQHLHHKGGVENTREVVKRDRNCLEAGEGTLQWEC